MKTNNIIYEEKIFAKWTTVILTVVAIGLLFIIEPISTHIRENELYLAIFLLVYIGVAFNFRDLSIKMTPQHVSVGYGIFKDTILWENIEDCYLDKASVIRYGGWGIRIGRVKGKWRQVYNVLGGPRVVLSLRKSGFFKSLFIFTIKEFVFSTKNPEKVMEIVKQKVGK